MGRTLGDCCEPLFQDVCRIGRQARAGLRIEPAAVRAELIEGLEDITARCESEGLAAAMASVDQPLRVFVDWWVLRASPAIESEWQPLYQGDKDGGEEDRSGAFFAGLDAALADTGTEGTQKLSVYLQCLGLGYSGDRDQESLRKTMVEVTARLRRQINADDKSKLCPEAYEHIDRSDLVQPPGKSLALIGVGLVGLVIVLVAMNAFLYSQSASSLVDSLSGFAEFAQRGANGS